MRGVRDRRDVRAARAYLGHCGADDVTISRGKRLTVSWTADGHGLSVTLAASPRDLEAATNVVRQRIRRRYRAIGVEVGA